VRVRLVQACLREFSTRRCIEAVDDRPDIVECLDTGKVWATSADGPIMFARPGPTVEYWEDEE
jgi:hypothetical protein